ncbi:hypothetical protein ATANTOWER_011050 [Ataeniobius toweri]|uniref:Uncharacterized protein n=1 Tax=Ataeniobius toweri TaxID=208326 RepID=A0ABU7AP10_9TELE|nr:hypothetical protein [Ataeniobius toweri]
MQICLKSLLNVNLLLGHLFPVCGAALIFSSSGLFSRLRSFSSTIFPRVQGFTCWDLRRNCMYPGHMDHKLPLPLFVSLNCFSCLFCTVVLMLHFYVPCVMSDLHKKFTKY